MTTSTQRVQLTVSRGRWTEPPRSLAALAGAHGSSSALLPANKSHSRDTERSIVQQHVNVRFNKNKNQRWLRTPHAVVDLPWIDTGKVFTVSLGPSADLVGRLKDIGDCTTQGPGKANTYRGCSWVKFHRGKAACMRRVGWWRERWKWRGRGET